MTSYDCFVPAWKQNKTSKGEFEKELNFRVFCDLNDYLQASKVGTLELLLVRGYLAEHLAV